MQTHEPCPICNSNVSVYPKMMMLNPVDEKRVNLPYRTGCTCHGGLAVSDLNQVNSHNVQFEQFVMGYFCNDCQKGFIANEITKPKPKSFIIK